MNEDLKFTEDRSLILLKLFVYLALNFIGIATVLYSHFVKPFARTRLLVGIGSTIYLVLTGLWTLYLQFRVVHTVYRGRKNKSSKKDIWLRSSVKFPQALYRIEVIDSISLKVTETLETEVGKWIDSEGIVCEDVLFDDLKQNLVPKFKFD